MNPQQGAFYLVLALSVYLVIDHRITRLTRRLENEWERWRDREQDAKWARVPWSSKEIEAQEKCIAAAHEAFLAMNQLDEARYCFLNKWGKFQVRPLSATEQEGREKLGRQIADALEKRQEEEHHLDLMIQANALVVRGKALLSEARRKTVGDYDAYTRANWSARTKRNRDIT